MRMKTKRNSIWYCKNDSARENKGVLPNISIQLTKTRIRKTRSNKHKSDTYLYINTLQDILMIFQMMINAVYHKILLECIIQQNSQMWHLWTNNIFRYSHTNSHLQLLDRTFSSLFSYNACLDGRSIEHPAIFFSFHLSLQKWKHFCDTIKKRFAYKIGNFL